MAFDRIHPAAFVPDPDGGPFIAEQFALNFPKTWREDVLALIKSGKTNPDSIRYIYISRLNAAIGAIAPDLLSVATRATVNDTMPWIYAAKKFPQDITNALIGAWLKDLQPKPDAHHAVREAWARLQTQDLAWNETAVDLLEHSISAGGTALPPAHLWRLLPDILAARIENAEEPYEYNKQQVVFRRVASNVFAASAELMSWPPLRHVTKGSKEDSVERTWYYSGTITVSLRTEPFSPVPRIHITTGIRHWIAGKPVFMPAGRSASVYLASETSLVDGAPAPERFAVARLQSTRNGEAWATGGPAGILGRLSATQNFPSPELLRKEPDKWLHGLDGITAAVVHHTMMGAHGAGAGLMPSERRRLVEWVGKQLAPQLMPAEDLRRTRFPLRQQNPKGVLEDKDSIKKPIRPKKPGPAATPEDIEAIEAFNAEADKQNIEIEARNREIAAKNAVTMARNAERRRERLTTVVGDRGLITCLLYQTDATRDRVIAAAEASLDLAAYRVESGPKTWSWQAPGLQMRIHARPLGRHGGALGGAKTPAKGQEWDQAIGQRRADVKDLIARIAAETGEPAQLSVVEIDDAPAFSKRSDPKFAIRLGLADAGLVSQFLVIADSESEEDQADAQFRAEAAWADGLRQVGMRFVPDHTLGEAIPEELNQVAFWLVKRRVDGPTGKAQFTPIAILIRPGQSSIMGRSPHTGGWVPYPELLRALTGRVREADLASEPQQSAATAAFVKQVLTERRAEATLVVTHAQNTRSRWPWLKNDELIADRIGFGEGGLRQRVSLYGQHLRVVRVATTERHEVPQWWAPKTEGAGISKGLWVPLGEDPRVFYSTAEKSATNSLSMDATKLTTRANGEIKPGKNASTPGLLQFAMAALQEGDDAETWAMFLHQQRFSDDYRGGLKLPLILHLAKLTADYALPHEEAEIAEEDEADEESLDDFELDDEESGFPAAG